MEKSEDDPPPALKRERSSGSEVVATTEEPDDPFSFTKDSLVPKYEEDILGQTSENNEVREAYQALNSVRSMSPTDSENVKPTIFARHSSHPRERTQIMHALEARHNSIGPGYLKSTAEMNAISFASERFRKLVDGLRTVNVDTRYILQQTFQWLLPDINSTEEQLAIHEALERSPMTLPFSDLCKILKLEESTDASPPGLKSHHYPYLRQWVLNRTEIELVTLAMMDQAGRTYDEVTAWRESIRLFNSDYYFIRYIGICVGPETPFGRMQGDRYNRKSGILHEFLNALASTFPEILEAGKAYVFKDGVLGGYPGQHRKSVFHRQSEEIERVLIAFFDYNTLLNRQRGGYFISYVPSYSDRVTFAALGTNYFSRFRERASLGVNLFQEQRIYEHYEKVQEDFEREPKRFGTELAPFTNQNLHAVVKDATPHLVNGLTPLLMIGKDVTFTDYRNADTFFEGKSRASMVVHDFLQRLARDEATENEVRFPPDFDPSTPFLDVWPCPMHRAHRWAQSHLKGILNVIRPLVVASFGKETNCITLANFKHNMGIAMNADLTDHIGNARVCFYSEAGVAKEDSAFINVAHIDPGRDKYTVESLPLRRVYDMTWQWTIMLADAALDVAIKYPEESSRPNRFTLCTEILEVIKTKLKTPAGKNWQARLKVAKLDLKHWYTEIRGRPGLLLTSGDRSLRVDQNTQAKLLLEGEGRNNIRQLGFAEGQPHSPERRTHLMTFWAMNLPDLHLTIDRKPENREKWIKFFMPLAPKQSYYFAVLSEFKEAEFLLKLLKLCPGNERWEEQLNANPDSRLRENLTLRCGLWISAKCEEDDIAAARSATLHPTPYYAASQLQGLYVGIGPGSGHLSIRWQKDKDTQISMIVQVWPARPSKPTDLRSLNFTDHGIDVNDAKGTPLRGQGTSATLELAAFNRLVANNVAANLWACWKAVREHETGRPYIQPEVEMDVVDGDEWPATKGVAYIHSNARSENPVQNRPPNSQDANYLLYKYLEAHLPDGGLLRTAPRDSVQQDDLVQYPNHKVVYLEDFVDFLQSKEYCRHPYAAELVSKFSSTSSVPEVNLLQKNIGPMRAATSHRQDVRQGVASIREHILQIGPLGTSNDDEIDFDAANLKYVKKKQRRALFDDEMDDDDEPTYEGDYFPPAQPIGRLRTSGSAAAVELAQHKSLGPLQRKRMRSTEEDAQTQDANTAGAQVMSGPSGGDDGHGGNDRPAKQPRLYLPARQDLVMPPSIAVSSHGYSLPPSGVSGQAATNTGYGGQAQASTSQQNQRRDSQQGGDPRTCYRCGQIGHIATHCTNLPQNNRGRGRGHRGGGRGRGGYGGGAQGSRGSRSGRGQWQQPMDYTDPRNQG